MRKIKKIIESGIKLVPIADAPYAEAETYWKIGFFHDGTPHISLAFDNKFKSYQQCQEAIKNLEKNWRQKSA